MVKQWIILVVIFIAAGCGPEANNSTPTAYVLPSVTPGQRIAGVLPPVIDLPPPDSTLSNPATAAARSAPTTPTPNQRLCPEVDASEDLAPIPNLPDDLLSEIARFLSSGGEVDKLENQLERRWDVLDENGYVRFNTDLTGEGEPEIILGLTAPGDLGLLAVFGCQDGRYDLLYQFTTDDTQPPEILWQGDLNRNFRNDLLFTSQICDEDSLCQYDTYLVEWQPNLGRFINLFEGSIQSDSIPRINDTDDDDVTEILIPLESSGTSATGPLRTGLHIYDWNGVVYTLSIIQLDPPRYRIQIIHEADRNFAQLAMEDAANLYIQAIDPESDMRYWFNDGETILTSYSLYRLLLVYAFTDDVQQAGVFERINTEFPLTAVEATADLPVYAEMAYAFWNTLTATSNLHSACLDVQGVIETREEALTLLNRYGRRNPTYTALDLCPF